MEQHIDGTWVISPQDLISEHESGHRVALDAAGTLGHLTAPKAKSASLELLRAKGLECEARRLAELPATLCIKKLSTPRHSIADYDASWQATTRAMDEEYDAIYQGTLLSGDIVGFADSHVRLGRPAPMHVKPLTQVRQGLEWYGRHVHEHRTRVPRAAQGLASFTRGDPCAHGVTYSTA